MIQPALSATLLAAMGNATGEAGKVANVASSSIAHRYNHLKMQQSFIPKFLCMKHLREGMRELKHANFSWGELRAVVPVVREAWMREAQERQQKS